jgi:hypothetical protein
MNLRRPKIYADYNKYDEEYRLILTCFGTFRDLRALGITLSSGQEYTFYQDSDIDEFGNIDNLLVDGVVEFDQENNRWVATIGESTYRHESEERKRMK